MWDIKDKKIVYSCRFCGFSSDDIDDFEEDLQHHKGFWCPYCDGFTYFIEEKRTSSHRYNLIFETTGSSTSREQRKKLPFKTQVSPLRWPGGKSRLVGQILERCNPENMENFVEPFAGGASVGLSLLLGGEINNLYLNDLDYGVFSLFQSIKHFPWELIRRIQEFSPDKQSYMESQKILKNGYENMDIVDAAWHMLVVNRLAFSGIPKANCLREPSARWNPKTLIDRVNAINSKSDNIYVSCEDACSYIEEKYWLPKATLFIDPPYKVKGKDLYMEFYETEDHDKLAFLLDELFKGMPGADILMTYDNDEYIKKLYRYPQTEEISRVYSIAN